MATGFVRLSFHLVVFIADAITVYYDLFKLPIVSQGFGGKFKFLTVWNICLQLLYFSLCLLKDLTEDEQVPSLHARRPRLQRWRDTFHSTVAFPVGMFVVMSFWIIYAVDRELVFPKALDEVFPSWLNHMLHTAVMPFILIDKFLFYHHHPKRHNGMLGACGLAMIYLVWILFIAWYDNFWVYPILEVLQAHERVIFISMCLALFASLYILGESITTFLWRKELTSTRRPKRN